MKVIILRTVKLIISISVRVLHAQALREDIH